MSKHSVTNTTLLIIKLVHYIPVLHICILNASDVLYKFLSSICHILKMLTELIRISNFNNLK